MEKNTKILIGASALAVAYYLYNASKAAAAVTQIGKTPMPPITTSNTTPVVTTPVVTPVVTIPVVTNPVVTTPVVTNPVVTNPVVLTLNNLLEPKTKPCEVTYWNCGSNPRETIQIPFNDDCNTYQQAKPPCAEPLLYRGGEKFEIQSQAELDAQIAAQIAADEAAAAAAQEEIDRLESARLYEEESARMRARDKANQEAYQAYLAEVAAQAAANKAIEDKIIADRMAAAKKFEDENAARQKAYNDYIKSTQTCPEFFEFSVTENRCVSSFSIQYDKVVALAKKGQGFIMRDMQRRDPQVTLVKTCPAGYVATYEKVIGEGAPQYIKDIECRPAYSLNYQQLDLQSRLDAGMAQTSDGYWHLNAAAAATAQAKIDATDAAAAKLAKYTPRQNNINSNICYVDTEGWINNPEFVGKIEQFSLSEYIGRFKVTAYELSVARASCPDSVYSAGRIAGGATDDNKLGYKPYVASANPTPVKNNCPTGYVYMGELRLSGSVVQKEGCYPEAPPNEGDLEMRGGGSGNIETEPTTKPCKLVYSNCGLPATYETIQIPWNADCNTYQPALPQCAPPQPDWVFEGVKSKPYLLGVNF
jgi:hypothetical protein